MTRAKKTKAAPLDEVMLAMDVVDTLRHSDNLVARELGEEDRASALMERLREVYRQQGIDVPDRILREGVAALNEARFAYSPPSGGLGYWLARFYVSRRKWGRPVTIILLAAIIGFVGYNFAYKPYLEGQAQAAIERVQTELPQEIDQLLAQIQSTAKVETAIATATEIAERGKTAAAAKDAVRAELAVADLNALLDKLRDEYRLQIVNREGADTGIWTFPDVNDNARNYYLIVEAIGTDGSAQTKSIVNEETGQAERVTQWGVRVSEVVFNGVKDDKLDDGIIQNNILGLKQYGYLDADYVIPVLGGEITQW
ncbi:DUF6384 family protein [Maritalea porphyrae]|uniref:Uncharacterized protein n=1 Tax=Maritalea porphyrae TaxID=880732 RepID=A0ABQ5UQ72_9HYPH|nr:DUF6384 family protein [Maritalea porphyrae]GLQ17426.1 hypothetical protein GCM10007879_16750 [Maritalea porphyrae]